MLKRHLTVSSDGEPVCDGVEDWVMIAVVVLVVVESVSWSRRMSASSSTLEPEDCSSSQSSSSLSSLQGPTKWPLCQYRIVVKVQGQGQGQCENRYKVRSDFSTKSGSRST